MEGIGFDVLIDKYGLLGGIGIAAITTFWTIVKSDGFVKIWARVSEWVIDNVTNKLGSKGHVNENDVLHHDIFNYVDFWAYSKVPTLNFSSEYRTVVFRKYLTIYLRVHKRMLTELVRSGKYKKMQQAELWKTLHDVFNGIVFECEKEFRDAGIPELIVRKMKNKNNDTIQLTLDLAENISNSRFYEGSDNLLKLYSILNIILSVMDSTMANAEQVCNSINGEMRGFTMDGKTEP